MEYIIEKEEMYMECDTAITLGKFDGIHIGHQLLIREVLAGKKQGLKPVVFTFSFAEKIRTDSIEGNLFTEEEKKEYLEQLGIEVMISYPFDEEMRCMEAEMFVEQILCKKLRAKKIVVGSDFAFGYQRRGDSKLLEQLSSVYGYELIVFDKVMLDGQIVSSSVIRQELLEGHMEKVNAMLGRKYSMKGTVVYGNQIGRKMLSMPTANIYPNADKLLPPNGVYVTMMETEYGEYEGITNIGYKPTIGGETRPGVESYLFDFDNDLYGQIIKVNFYMYKRGERKFNGLEELKAQMFRDSDFGRDYFKQSR
ncbi:bifunctional riboflavin kinase/FAD synthetase [Anaerosporobacter sp.]|uniref:bifunctional riboflavin kinase/FAD synthetase n=1 Tax=Anaerosporobacter sp. TaxID=1872529 RepID=UPI00286EEC74|nr:bifunctional riboflavin kinase/FAD synthetase [Anaerosporobacter sp.]